MRTPCPSTIPLLLLAAGCVSRPAGVEPGLHREKHAPGRRPGRGLLHLRQRRLARGQPGPRAGVGLGRLPRVRAGNQEVLREILEQGAADPRDDLERQLGDFYASGMNVERIEELGLQPVMPWLERIEALRSTDEFIALLPELHQVGVSVLSACSRCRTSRTAVV